MLTEEELLKQILEEAKKPRRKGFDDISCEQALKLVEKRKKKKKYEGVEVEEALRPPKLGPDPLKKASGKLDPLKSTPENLGTLIGIMNKVSGRSKMVKVIDAVEKNSKLEKEFNKALLDVIRAFRQAGVK
jgi:hypothetical protein